MSLKQTVSVNIGGFIIFYFDRAQPRWGRMVSCVIVMALWCRTHLLLIWWTNIKLPVWTLRSSNDPQSNVWSVLSRRFSGMKGRKNLILSVYKVKTISFKTFNTKSKWNKINIFTLRLYMFQSKLRLISNYTNSNIQIPFFIILFIILLFSSIISLFVFLAVLSFHRLTCTVYTRFSSVSLFETLLL